MKRNALGLLGLYAMAASLSKQDMYNNPDKGDNPIKPKDIDVKPKTVLPKGCKEIFFTKEGEWYEYGSDSAYFKCVASSEKNAKRKFDNYIKNK